MSNSASRLTDDGAAEFEHATVENDAGSIECTIFPRNCDAEEIVTRWITADDGSFVPLVEMR